MSNQKLVVSGLSNALNVWEQDADSTPETSSCLLSLASIILSDFFGSIDFTLTNTDIW